MRIDVLTLFPEMFESVLGSSILKRAAMDMPQRPAPVQYHLHNIRDYTTDKHQKVDKAPFGGGPGMVIQCQPVWDAVQAVEAMANATDATTAPKAADATSAPSAREAPDASSAPETTAAPDAQNLPRPVRILMSPQGRPLTQGLVEELAKAPRVLIIAGHYEGFDERVIQKLDPLEISIGDYVLSGGELPAMVLIDAIVRLIPGVLGDETSADHESFSDHTAGGLDYPHYTRPQTWMGMDVPEILLSGNHAAIEAWRKEQSRLRTQQRRPDLAQQQEDSARDTNV